MKPYKIFVVVQPGLEDIAESEINNLGYSDLERIKGGFFLYGHLSTVIKLNCSCRCISRVLIEIAEFEAKTFFQLEQHFNQINWQDYLSGQHICIHVSSYQSALYHEKAVAERLINSLSIIMNKTISVVGSPDEEDTQLIVVYAKHDKFTVRMDTSGMHLHKRGYGICKEDAPLRETIACAMLYSAGWNKRFFSLHDPMCGSGTIAIEAALMAQNIPWCVFREFAFQKWRCYNPDVFEKVKAKLLSETITNPQVRINASDIDEKAVVSAKVNVHKAGVENLVNVKQVTLSECIFDRDDTIITNPPWGIRLHSRDNVDTISILSVLNKSVSGIYVLLSEAISNTLNVKSKPLFHLKSGNIKVSFIRLD
jgi:putative N6-adenine-specific DNA methylase